MTPGSIQEKSPPVVADLPTVPDPPSDRSLRDQIAVNRIAETLAEDFYLSLGRSCPAWHQLEPETRDRFLMQARRAVNFVHLLDSGVDPPRIGEVERVNRQGQLKQLREQVRDAAETRGHEMTVWRYLRKAGGEWIQSCACKHCCADLVLDLTTGQLAKAATILMTCEWAGEREELGRIGL